MASFLFQLYREIDNIVIFEVRYCVAYNLLELLQLADKLFLINAIFYQKHFSGRHIQTHFNK